MKLDGLVRPDPKERLSLAKVVEDLMGPPYNFKMPESCFRFSIYCQIANGVGYRIQIVDFEEGITF